MTGVSWTLVMVLVCAMATSSWAFFVGARPRVMGMKRASEAVSQTAVWASQAGAGGLGGEAGRTAEMESLREAISERKEVVTRGFESDKGLPLLGDRNNYYSGEYEGKFWHQNADQVYVFVPVPVDLPKRAVDVQFDARAVHVLVDGMDSFSFPCTERIIPDGCFWVLEQDSKSGDKYLMLDLEKRFRMINWKSLFGAAQESELEADEATRRMQMLKSLIQSKGGEMMGELGDEDDAADVAAATAAGGGGGGGGGGGEPAVAVDAERADMIKQMVTDAGAALYGDDEEGEAGDGDAYWRQRLAQERREGGEGADPDTDPDTAAAVVDVEVVDED